MNKKVSFEKQLEKLEKIRDQLESGELTLDESIKLYESGIKQFKVCQELLSQFEAKIEELSVDDFETSDLDEEE